MLETIVDSMIPVPFGIDQVKRNTRDTFTLTLSPQEVGQPFTFLPGQFNMLYVYGIGEVPISISGDPAGAHPLKHTTRMVGTVTRAMGALQKGDTIGVRGPFGMHWPIEKAKGKDVVFMAGGIGLAPLRPAICAVLSQREQYGRVILLYGNRTPEDILFRGDLERWADVGGVEVLVTVDRAVGDWRGHVGVVTTLVAKGEFDARNAMAFLCGPEIMMYFSVQTLMQRGLTGESVYVSMERNMKCAIGFCGHCQYGSHFICKDGPVFNYPDIADIFRKAQV